ncbi:MAG: ComF family protein [Candidatus Paceibacterota bacterium]
MFFTLIKAKEIALDIIFPRICIGCEKRLNDKTDPVCNACLESIKINSAFFCPICKGRLPDVEKTCHPGSRFILASAGNYDDPVLQKIIKSFKYQGIENLAPVLGKLIIKYVKNCESKIPQLSNYQITFIPLHKSRERQRGFNQAELIAKSIAEYFNLPLIKTIKRSKKTEPQAKMKNKEKRLKNISGCFSIPNPDSVKNKNVILIDDVFTTGDTINEAVKILKENGVKKIIALVAAKA